MKYERLMLWTILLFNVLILANVEEDITFKLIWYTMGMFIGFTVLASIFMDAMGIKVVVKE